MTTRTRATRKFPMATRRRTVPCYKLEHEGHFHGNNNVTRSTNGTKEMLERLKVDNARETLPKIIEMILRPCRDDIGSLIV